MKKYSIILIVIIFSLLYYPPLLKINTLHIVGGFSWFYILLHKKSISENLSRRKIINLYVLIVLLTVHIFIIAFLNENSYQVIAAFFYWMIDIIPACIMVIDMCIRRKYTEMDLLVLLLVVGNVQGLFSLLAFVFPEFQSLFVQGMLNHGFSDIFLQLATFRLYGVASNLTFSTPIIQSIFAMIAVYLTVNKSFKFILLVPLPAFSAIINARASIVIMLVGFVAILISLYKINARHICKIITLVVLGVACITIFSNIIKAFSPETYHWIDTGIEEITMFLRGDTTGYFGYVTSEEKYTLPSGFELLFGKGVYVMREGKYGFLSDVGWINDIWMGGIIYSAIIYVFYGRLLLHIHRYNVNHEKISKFLSVLFLGTFFVGNFKGYIISSNEIMTVLFLLFLFVTGKQHNDTNKYNFEEPVQR